MDTELLLICALTVVINLIGALAYPLPVGGSGHEVLPLSQCG